MMRVCLGSAREVACTRMNPWVLRHVIGRGLDPLSLSVAVCHFSVSAVLVWQNEQRSVDEIDIQAPWLRCSSLTAGLARPSLALALAVPDGRCILYRLCKRTPTSPPDLGAPGLVHPARVALVLLDRFQTAALDEWRGVGTETEDSIGRTRLMSSIFCTVLRTS